MANHPDMLYDKTNKGRAAKYHARFIIELARDEAEVFCSADTRKRCEILAAEYGFPKDWYVIEKIRR